jgi:hypothetical protein
VVVRVRVRVGVGLGWVGILLRQVDCLLLSLIELFEAVRGRVALGLRKLNMINIKLTMEHTIRL